MDLVIQENLILHERRISLSEFHAADEVCNFLFSENEILVQVSDISFLFLSQND